MLVEGLAALIPGNAVIAAALNIGTRSDGYNGVFPAIAPDEAIMPYIVMQQLTRETIMSYQGVNRLQFARWRFSCYGPSYKTAKTIAEDLKQLLDGFTGVLAEGTVVGNTVPASEVDDIEEAFKATLYATHVDYEFTYQDNVYQVKPPPNTFQNLFAFPTLARIALAPSAPGNFTVAHGLGQAPVAVFIEMTFGGEIYFQPVTQWDATNLYLVATDAGVTGYALCYVPIQ